MDRLVILAIAVIAAIPAFGAGLILEDRANLIIERPQIQFVGYGCEGTTGYAIYAADEDMLPVCQVIKRI